MATLIQMNKAGEDSTECQMIAEVIGGIYYQPNYDRFNRIYSSEGVSPTIATRCDRFSSFWICVVEDNDSDRRNTGTSERKG